jgi:hypothetical protein
VIGNAHPYGHYNTRYKSALGKWFEKWLRRTISLTIFHLIVVIMVPLFALLFPFALIIDLIRRNGMPLIRIIGFFCVYFVGELMAIWVYGLLVYLLSWIFFFTPETWQKSVYTCQHYWGARTLTAPSMRVLGCSEDVEGLELISPEGGPYILFMRHNSFADTLMPQYLFSDRFRMRYVVKKSLLYDPGIDIIGNRSPNLYLDREAGEGMAEEVKALASLLDDYAPEANIITAIWPEGTRFTPKKREYILNKLRLAAEKEDSQKEKEKEKEKDTDKDVDEASKPLSAREMYEKAESLKWTLPPRITGVLALLEKNETKGADVVFCAHSGFEHARDFWALANGGLYNKKIYAKFWRVRFDDIPKDRNGRIRWLFDFWAMMDNWIAQKKEEEVKAQRGSKRGNKKKD